MLCTTFRKAATAIRISELNAMHNVSESSYGPGKKSHTKVSLKIIETTPIWVNLDAKGSAKVVQRAPLRSRGRFGSPRGKTGSAGVATM